MASTSGVVDNAPLEDLITTERKNSQNAICPRCKSIILRPLSAILVNMPEPLRLPGLTVKASGKADWDGFTDFWRVADPFTYENVGFTNTVEKRKYLTCADCEIGPLGYQDIGAKESFLAIQRVCHEPENDSASSS